MPNAGDPTKPPLPTGEAFFDLLIETLENLDRPARAQFLQRFLKAVAQVDLTDSMSLEYWERILARRQQLSESLGTPIPLKTAMVDVLVSSNFLRMPILMEYEELKKLQINAATDPLTGLYNRRLFEEYFEKELNRARRYNLYLALVVMDLHRFKEVNDRYGHPRGDQMLQMAASMLRQTMRTSDFAFRIGGDEFALLLPQADAEQADTLGRRVRLNYAAAIQPVGLDLPLALDYGLAVYPQDSEQADELIRVADRRLYEMKKGKRGRAPEEQAAQPPPAPRKPAPSPEPHAAPPAPKPPGGERPATERRRWERVSLAGTNASAELSEHPARTARVLNLGYGGVALEVESAEPLAVAFQAVLHVPILPSVRVSLRRVYVAHGTGAAMRVGCAFVS